MKISEANKLIAEFMGAEVLEVYLNPEKEVDHYLMDMGKDRLVNSRYIANTTMKYHESWDWLMPVVEKVEYQNNFIEVVGFECKIWDKGLARESSNEVLIWEQGDIKIEAVYTALIKYIKYIKLTES